MKSARIRAAIDTRRLAPIVAVSLMGLGACSSANAPTPDPSRSSSPAATKTRQRTSQTSANVYAAAGANMLSPKVKDVPYRLYVPESAGRGIDVIDATTRRVVARYDTGLDPQHVVPAYDLSRLYVTNDMANTLTPISPVTGRPSGSDIPVDDPYNMYFTPGGKQAVVVAEAHQHLDFYDARTFKLQQRVPVSCAGIDHADFSADGRFMVASCEFAGRLVKVDLASHRVEGYLDLKGSSPQDVRLAPDGKMFWVADMYRGGVHFIDANSFSEVGFVATGKDAHGIYPSRDATRMYVSNRGSGTVSVFDASTRRIVATWSIPGGGSPDMGGVSADGKILWLTGRYSSVVYGFDTGTGQVVDRIVVPNKPHGMCVWPQPGRFSLGHTGNMR